MDRETVAGAFQAEQTAHVRNRCTKSLNNPSVYKYLHRTELISTDKTPGLDYSSV